MAESHVLAVLDTLLMSFYELSSDSQSQNDSCDGAAENSASTSSFIYVRLTHPHVHWIQTSDREVLDACPTHPRSISRRDDPSLTQRETPVPSSVGCPQPCILARNGVCHPSFHLSVLEGAPPRVNKSARVRGQNSSECVAWPMSTLSFLSNSRLPVCSTGLINPRLHYQIRPAYRVPWRRDCKACPACRTCAVHAGRAAAFGARQHGSIHERPVSSISLSAVENRQEDAKRRVPRQSRVVSVGDAFHVSISV